jgi:hypothetical protein
MTDFEKISIKMKLARALTIAGALIACTWKVSIKISEFNSKMDILIANDIAHARRDSINEAAIAKNKRDIDSLKIVFHMVALNGKGDIRYFRQRKVGGHLITEEVND